jgi:Domain of unknown function (DUF5060)/Divergent InlB B-repeat domain
MDHKFFDLLIFYSVSVLMLITNVGFSQVIVTGNMKIWHPVTLTIDGPSVDESETTFRNYRLDVTFTKGSKTFKVPGFFAADGNAAETSATSGNKWRAIFTPDEVGAWSYTVSLRTGNDLAISFDPTAGTPTIGDGEKGAFTIKKASSNEQGFFAKGKLGYVGEHYGQFAGNKEWHVKAGPGGPEDFFGYKDFDNTADWNIRKTSTQVQDTYLQEQNGEGLHFFKPHVTDWKTGDPSWKDGKGKGIIGALNYMASIGINSLYMIPFSINDDSDNTWPWTSRDLQMSYDVSKLAQWDIVLSHMDKVGISSTYYLCESANSRLLDGGSMILKYPIYYREVVARFGYHLGIRFNIGEETQQSKEQQDVACKQLDMLDPYQTIIGLHSKHKREDQVSLFDFMLGKKYCHGPQYQLHEKEKKDHLDLIMWRAKSSEAGHKWIVANDESWPIDNTLKGEVKMLDYTWRTFMAGGEGLFQYTGYSIPAIGDITMENFRLIENTQKILIAAKELFLKPEINKHLPQLKNENTLVDNPIGNDAPFCLSKKGQLYIIYRTSVTNQKPLNLAGISGLFNINWYDAKNGGVFQNGSVTKVMGGATVDLGNPPKDAEMPWVIILSKDATICKSEKLITLTSSSTAGASVSGAGKYCLGQTASVVATATDGAQFLNWTEKGKVVSVANPYQFKVNINRTLVANFKKGPTLSYRINASPSSETSGTTVGTGTYAANQLITVTAVANPCFKFENWTENNTVVSNAISYTFNTNASRNLVANFSAKINTVLAEPASGGTVKGELKYSCGDLIKVTAKPNAGFQFDGWYANDTLLTKELTDDINISSDFQLQAKFSLKRN